MKVCLNFFFIAIFTFSYGQHGTQIDSLQSVVKNYHNGFNHQDIGLVKSSLGEQLNMFNSNSPDKAQDWEAHMFLQNDEIDEWIKWMFENAGPFHNAITFKKQHIRSNSAIVVTQETGYNKFRSWKKEEVVYQLGKTTHGWQILSFFIKNGKNPD